MLKKELKILLGEHENFSRLTSAPTAMNDETAEGKVVRDGTQKLPRSLQLIILPLLLHLEESMHIHQYKELTPRVITPLVTL
jgi:hypothetical protein